MSRVAIVTGAARGIGAATVDALVNDGYRVIAVDRAARPGRLIDRAGDLVGAYGLVQRTGRP